MNARKQFTNVIVVPFRSPRNRVRVFLLNKILSTIIVSTEHTTISWVRSAITSVRMITAHNNVAVFGRGEPVFAQPVALPYQQIKGPRFMGTSLLHHR